MRNGGIETGNGGMRSSEGRRRGRNTHVSINDGLRGGSAAVAYRNGLTVEGEGARLCGINVVA